MCHYTLQFAAGEFMLSKMFCETTVNLNIARKINDGAILEHSTENMFPVKLENILL
jgi:hypothetical protein